MVKGALRGALRGAAVLDRQKGLYFALYGLEPLAATLV